MRKILCVIATLAVFSACNQPEKKHEEKTDHSQMGHKDGNQNSMMQSMAVGMNAMHEVKLTGNPDYDFAAMMIPHHEAAISMSMLLLKSSADGALASFGVKVIEAQKAEVKILTDFIRTALKTPVATAGEFKKVMNQSMQAMMTGMKDAKLTENVQKDYIILMIPHHQSAVDMAKAYLPYAKNEKIKQMANEIVKAQEAEINWLKKQL